MSSEDVIKLSVKPGDKVKAIKTIPNYFVEDKVYEVVYVAAGFVKLRPLGDNTKFNTVFVGAEIFNRYFAKLIKTAVKKGENTPTTAQSEPVENARSTAAETKKPSSGKLVSKDEVYSILENATIEVNTVFDRCTQVTCKLPSGFVIAASSGAASAESYDEDYGTDVCMHEIEQKLWELETYRRMTDDYIDDEWYDDYADEFCDDCDEYAACHSAFYGRQYR